MDIFHESGVVGVFVFEAVEVEEAVDGVKGEFDFGGVTVGQGVVLGGGGAHDDFAVFESDDIGGAWDAHKIAVDFGDGAIGNDGDLDFVDFGEGEEEVCGVGDGLLEGQIGEVLEPGEVEGAGALAVGDMDFHLAATGGEEGRGNSLRSVRVVG